MNAAIIKPQFDIKTLINADDIKADALKHSKHGNAKIISIAIQKHTEVLDRLLNELTPVDFREYLGLDEDEKVKQNDIVVGVIKRLLEVAKAKKWNLCKTFDYVYIYNGAYWMQMDKDDLKQF